MLLGLPLPRLRPGRGAPPGVLLLRLLLRPAASAGSGPRCPRGATGALGRPGRMLLLLGRPALGRREPRALRRRAPSVRGRRCGWLLFAAYGIDGVKVQVILRGGAAGCKREPALLC